MSLARTPWVDKSLRSFWDRIVEHAPAEWMPVLVPDQKFSVEELGCGHYGCVMPTHASNLVCKLTSDVSEAHFVSIALELPHPEGIVKYFKIFALRDATRMRRPLFVLWREGAKDIGWLASSEIYRTYNYDDYLVGTIRSGARKLDTFKQRAHEIRNAINRMLKRAENRAPVLEEIWKTFEHARVRDPRHLKSIPWIANQLRICWDIALELENREIVNPIGEALRHYMDEGILLADVHYNNIGRTKNDQLVITDPGHAVEFHPQWATLPKIEVI